MGIARLVHLAHAALPDRADEFIQAELVPTEKARRRNHFSLSDQKRIGNVLRAIRNQRDYGRVADDSPAVGDKAWPPFSPANEFVGAR